ncbi:DUF2218 domain-containing protein [Actibacterium lipolyticum]|uniref:DUF2218 domain-containing protein n=1 Tax=Actibacterium lipolyticum TaxID=1524263 RepID=A0A238L8A1_9RHOB|nr:DUF2218 domain-containing protein [Actibacterium lipolyticum]SMX51061.1 hypothetical protein COL8621_03591 [Actibacterium lipolyticum]
MYAAKSVYKTSNGSKYLQQLCKHFSHKVDVTYDAQQGECELSSGPALIKADAEGISFHLTGQDPEGIILAKYVIDSHLVTFAHRENFTGLSWTVTQENT